MPPRIARLAGFGAFGACAGLLALYVFLVVISRPAQRGGIDAISAAVAWIALGGLFAALIGAHLVIARRLMLLSNGDVPHPLGAADY